MQRVSDISPLLPDSVAIDFEVGLMNAINDELPNARISGCLFHFSQAMWRNIQHLGLTRLYKEDPEVRRFCRQLMALPFLPTDQLPHAYALIEQTAIDNVEDDPAELFEYYQAQWIDNDAMPLAVWNSNESDVRTNNAVEGFHHRFNRLVTIPTLGF